MDTEKCHLNRGDVQKSFNLSPAAKLLFIVRYSDSQFLKAESSFKEQSIKRLMKITEEPYGEG